MDHLPCVLADQDRLELFSVLGQSHRLFRDAEVWTDDNGVGWTGVRLNGIGIGLTWLGPGWVFDPQAREDRSADYAARLRTMQSAKRSRHRRKLALAARQLRLGAHAERLLWAIHQAVVGSGTSLLCLSDRWLATAVWGDTRPKHWRHDLRQVLRSLTWLHVASWPDASTMPAFGTASVLLNHAGDLRDSEDDVCTEDCPDRDGCRHHHFQIDIGPAFLGVMEQFGRTDDSTGTRTYTFPTGSAKSKEPGLWRVGKTGKLVSVFLPAMIGEPAACGAFTVRQRRLLQAIVRETTRAKREHRKDASEAEVFPGNQILDFHGKKMKECPQLLPNEKYVGFNGNRKRKGLGYRIDTPTGWPGKAGYALSEVVPFLRDLQALEVRLGLTVVGVQRGSRDINLDKLLELAASPVGHRKLQHLHLRIYTGANYIERWTSVFQGTTKPGGTQMAAPAIVAVSKLLDDMAAKNISRRALAVGIDKDHSFLAKLLMGKKPSWPEGLLEKAQKWVRAQKKVPSRSVAGSSRRRRQANGTVLDEALRRLGQGWSVVPQKPGAKKPCVRWKPFKDRRPTQKELTGWFERWPDAGLALVLGPVSGVIVIDVDGPEAHVALMERLGGQEPIAPKVLSGSGKPYRYHLFFRCPDLPTKSKQTPWHEHLEFRGYGGIVIVPPSLHPSGNSYRWAARRSPDDLDLPELPSQVIEALKPVPLVKPQRVASLRRKISVAGIDASPRTLEFLTGKHAEGPHWNDKLFLAACDLCGRGMPMKEAEPLLLAGAAPWNQGEKERACATIESAYSRPREPARH